MSKFNEGNIVKTDLNFNNIIIPTIFKIYKVDEASGYKTYYFIKPLDKKLNMIGSMYVLEIKLYQDSDTRKVERKQKLTRIIEEDNDS